MSVLDFVHLGSTLSLRSFSRFSSSMSVLDFVHLGSTLSLRSWGRLSSAVSVRGLARFGSTLSLFDDGRLGSSLSVRSFAKAGSSVSVRGLSRFGSVFSMSVLDFLHLGSSLSLRSFARLGSSLRVNAGQMIALDGSTSATPARILYDSTTSKTQIYGGGGATKSLSMGTAGGTLHGVWVSDNAIASSDRRLKKDVAPLLAHVLNVADLPAEGKDLAAEPTAWLLRQLRPVSFTRSASGSRSYGFIAQELEKLLPDVVQPLATSEEGEGLKGVAYQDLIALLTVFVQQQQLRLERGEQQVQQRLERFAEEQVQQRLELAALRAENADLKE